MNPTNLFEIRRYDFKSNIMESFCNIYYAKDNWPVVYILSNGQIKEAYVGETADVYARMTTHLRNGGKNKLSTVHLITSGKFNKSATLDIESNLIKYISGDGQYQLLNGNIGLSNHNYFQKREVYWELFKSVWDRLRAEGISKHSIDYINNSDLFKYSPYKSLTKEQRNGLLAIMKNLLSDSIRNTIVEGGAGTGKTILAVFLFKLLNSNNEDFNFKEFGNDEAEFVRIVHLLKEKYPKPKMALVIPMASFRETIKKIFRNVKGLTANMVIGPAEIAKEKFDIILVDESHRLRRRANLGTYFRAFDEASAKLNLNKLCTTELDWVLTQSTKSVLFYDENQSIKPSDVKKEDFDKLKANVSTSIQYLKSQLRVKGGNDYVEYVNKLLSGSFQVDDRRFSSKEYDFLLFDSFEGFINEIKLRDKEVGLCRFIAGYSWEWISQKDDSLFDIKIGEVELKWNSVSKDWINSKNAINEVGCIHTTQGYDLNYAGVIFGKEISYDKGKNEIVILKENYYDRNGKASISDPTELKSFIINIYSTILQRGMSGTYVYACDPSLRDYLARYISLAERKIATPIIVAAADIDPSQSYVPFYDLRVAAGAFSENQLVENVQYIKLPSHIRASDDLFACKVIGESMNRIIPSGAICLFKKYQGGSRNGKVVLVQHTSIQDNDFGSGYTVKEYQSIKAFQFEQWRHESIILRPLSDDLSFRDIQILADELDELKVIGVFECVLYKQS